MKTRTKVVTGIIALMLSCVLLFTSIVICNNTNNFAAVTASTRTVELSISPEYDNYLTGFKEKTLDYDDCTVSFHGVMEYDERVLSLFDEIALADEVDTEKSNIVYDCSFDMDKMQYTFKVLLLDQNDEVIEVEEMVTDAFVTETGQLDAYIELDGETYLLSDYVSTDAIDNCLFGWLKAIVAVVIVIVVVYVAIAETAEQIKAKQNYDYNKKLETAKNGVYKGNYITDQSETNRKGYNSGNYRFGFTTFDGVGCEVASVYNLLIDLNKAEMLSETIYNFEKWAIEFSIAWGKLGSNPSEIYRYLKKKSISYTKYTSYSSFKTALAKKDKCKVIMSSWNNGGMLKSVFNGDGLHTYYFKKLDSSSFEAYNLHYSDSTYSYNSIDKIYAEGGDFIVAYIIN